ncbi:2,3-dihydro-2,3-dihydroxybenzoate dehydrogenase [Tahibacter amnicola]|uniref:2,3-dihydro-2,3-dihydroxybenzoate dehydrogenase n=1 Tax=Tahibacter amnicola TaxID=2976241 RepID=A0ABY6B977_9GAMM|nr:2,3-dihydro-2,3-dihydroxybenzoate dehydrogenase [Tahibacter amnicola]UXI66618.1 2,3-dihydro-2,3-dihydroxybenzoate dehydrogenase [Tahibacter amnicola]
MIARAMPIDCAGEFSGKTVLITGAAQGIGAAVATAFAATGATLSLLDQQHVPLEQTARRLRAGGTVVLTTALDVTLRTDVDAAVSATEATLGPVDILVNVAGILRTGQVLALDTQDWADSFSVNTHGVFHVCQSVGRRMAERRRGSIVTVGSNAAGVPRMGMAAYAASKAAATQFMRCLALELAPFGIRCNTVSPGSTDTAMQRALWTSGSDAERVIKGSPETFRLGIPLGRIADPPDIAAAVCFLASDRARHITMHDLRVDGGATFDA